MGEQLTAQQRTAVFDRGGKLLVSAAAGSGKTKVLVDRILSYLKDPVSPANLDDFLVITYTKAAAAELRGKIAAKLSEEISNDPTNRHLQKQMQRLYLAKISTVHAFCGDLLREYAYRLDIPSDFRVAEENECEEMQRLLVGKMLDAAYTDIQNNPDFSAFAATQGFGRNDRQLPEIILKLYKNARCHMDPDGWLDWCLRVVDNVKPEVITDTPWVQYLIRDLHHYLDLQINALQNCIDEAKNAEGLAKPVALLSDTVVQLQNLRNCNSWDQIVSCSKIDFGTLSFPRKNFDTEVAAQMKAVRENCKAGITEKLRKFSDDSKQVAEEIAETASAARGLISFTRLFIKEYDRVKKNARVLDFGDLEHKTLDILMGKHRQGPTTIAAEVGRRYCEVMVDEYQDSNEVQDAIFSAITEKKHNCFMVGDVKQSIYQFRRADPEIFLKKYSEYVDAEAAQEGIGRRVVLSSNFRSGQGVINAVNDVFSVCMSRQVGGLCYGKDEMLYEGIPHEPLGELEVELYGIVADDSVYDEEPEFVVQRVLELLDGSHMIRKQGSLKPIEPEDIAILLRSPGSVGHHYLEAFDRFGIPCVAGSTNNLFDTEEVQTLYAILQVIDNPLQDIPLISVLTSKVFGFASDDLARIRVGKRNATFFDALKVDLEKKSVEFVLMLNSLRDKARTSTLLGLIKHTLTYTKLDSIYSAMPDGEARTENLLGFYNIAAEYDSRGGMSLSLFLAYLQNLEEKGVAIPGRESASNAVKIMSIHKSKGLEFPVVILPGLSRKFNNENAYDNMLCDKDLGIGLSCIDTKNRVRYPSVAKRAISTKILAESLSEEMRVLYVAMTRAKDRLIMTYTSKTLSKKLNDIALRMPFSATELLTAEASCPGDWILLSAMRRSEAGAFFSAARRPENVYKSETPWRISLIENPGSVSKAAVLGESNASNPQMDIYDRLKTTLGFQYPYKAATETPSKQTATQMKGRDKDLEASEDTASSRNYAKVFRRPTFADDHNRALKKGNAMHAVLQHIKFSACTDAISIANEIDRMVAEGYLDEDMATFVVPESILHFFKTDIGKKVKTAKNVLREFKFSILDDAGKYIPDIQNEEILLQGVVDCAVIEDDGITVIDFKTDHVKDGDLLRLSDIYRPQILTYANALGRIYKMPVKAALLYFFDVDEIVTV